MNKRDTEEMALKIELISFFVLYIHGMASQRFL